MPLWYPPPLASGDSTMHPIGPSLPFSPSSQVMMSKPLFWKAAEFRIVGTLAASQSSPCLIGLFVGAQESCMSSHRLGVMKLYWATVLFVRSVANSANGRTTSVHAGLTEFTTSSKNTNGLWRTAY